VTSSGQLKPPNVAQRPAVDLSGPSPNALIGQKPGRFLFVDALRGIAALWVVIYHAYEGDHLEQVASRLPGWALLFFEGGHLGVPIFFVLSGFVIAHSVSRYTVDLPFIGRFAFRRSIRLDPPYWASLLLVIGFGILSKIVIPSKPYDPPGVGLILAHLFYVQEILGYPSINPIYWTLALEIQFYLVFCLLMGLSHATRRDSADRRSLHVVFAIALLVAAAWPLGLFKGNIWPGLFPPHWHGFLLGMLACWAMNGTVKATWFYAYAALVGFGAAWTANSFAGACVATSTLLLVAARTNGLGSWLGWRWLQFLGLISYSLYLIHNPISGALYNVGFRITGRSAAMEVFWFAVMIATNIVAAASAWWLIERPSLGWAHRVRLKPR
jgi:peptidoglycan/LPS O-acetylase OafA/YrhL